MKTKKQVKKAYDNAIDYQQTIIHIDKNIRESERCAGFQDALLWVLGPRDIKTYRPYSKKKEKKNDIANRI